MYFLGGNHDLAENIARRFGISPRTLLRDIRLLREGGCPIESHFDRGGYSLPRDLRLHCPQFTPAEIAALLCLSEFVNQAVPEAARANVRSALDKTLAASLTDYREWAQRSRAKVASRITDSTTLAETLAAVAALLKK